MSAKPNIQVFEELRQFFLSESIATADNLEAKWEEVERLLGRYRAAERLVRDLAEHDGKTERRTATKIARHAEKLRGALLEMGPVLDAEVTAFVDFRELVHLRDATLPRLAAIADSADPSRDRVKPRTVFWSMVRDLRAILPEDWTEERQHEAAGAILAAAEIELGEFDLDTFKRKS
ncbi:MAG: hypothetical protein AAGE01_15445 [Pseudomonadota bacterium]